MKKIVYILGSTRSGSTMLDLVIASHPECATVGELCLLSKRACGMCGGECDYWKRYRKAIDGNSYYKTAFDVFDTNMLVDSSKKWKWLLSRMKHEKYDYRIIHLVRNGLDRLRFRKKQDRKIRTSVVQAWVNTHRMCEEIRKKQGGIMVKYEDLASDECLEKVFAFIGLPYAPNVKEFWKYKHHGLLGSKSAYSLVKAYHNIEGEHMAFAEQHGFNLTPRLGHEFLSAKDIKTFNKHGGGKLNKELGYA